jgi:hypothetical protein
MDSLPQPDPKQLALIKKFQSEQDRKVAVLQNNKYGPNYGASDGGYSYIFTPTGLGCVVHVRNNITNEELDITDYDKW